MFTGFHHVAIICSDYTASKHFYTDILNCDVLAEHYQPERQSYKLDLRLPDGSQIELFCFQNAPERPSYPEARGLRHLAFKVEDLDLAVAYLNDRGVETEPVRIDPYTGKRFTFFTDPDQLPLEIYEV